jgi:uncharacterized protein YcfL
MKTILLPAVVAASLFAAGCHTVNTTETAQPAFQRNMVAEKRVITDSTLARKVEVLGANTSLTPGGFLKVQVELRNNKSSLQKFSYKWEWFDENGMAVGGATSVTLSRQIEGKETLFVTAVAPVITARDFRLKLFENAP